MNESYSASYAAAGVDITAGYKAVELMKAHAGGTHVDFFRAAAVQELNRLPQLGAPDDRIVYKQQLLALNQLRDRLLKTICEEMGFSSLGYQSIDGLLEAIGIDKEKICTYCWTGQE